MKDGTLETRYGLFEAVGVELEYMLVDRESLSVAPIADRLLGCVSPDGPEAEVEFGPIAWSNELVLHVIELKTNGPAASLEGLAAAFQENVNRVQDVLQPLGARLLPTGMHPWMDPLAEARLWPHEYGPVYEAFDRIFGCRGHGWSNLQSTHINLPFEGDEEFGRLHAAIRMVLPIIPALAASSPIADGRVSRWLDTRLEVYRHNARQVPSVTGAVIPERVFDRRAYDDLLESVYDALAPQDPGGVLRHPWVNARGCIARFDRGSIEIRVIDSQECALADVAVCALVSGAVRSLAEERLSTTSEQRGWSESGLARIFLDVIAAADRAVIRDADYLRCLGFPQRSGTAGELWSHLAQEVPVLAPEWKEALDVLLLEGCLARRILSALKDPGVGEDVRRDELRAVYGALADCVAAGRMFVP